MSVEKNNDETITVEKFASDKFYSITKEAVPFTQLCNFVIQNIKNTNAGFLWVYMSSLPTNWNINKHQLAKHFDVSIRTIERSLSYLNDFNLIKLVRTRNEDGTLGVTKIIVLNGSKYEPDLEIQPCDKFVVMDKSPHKSRASSMRQKTMHGDLSHIQINNKNKNKKETTTENNPKPIKKAKSGNLEKQKDCRRFSLEEKIEDLVDTQIAKHGQPEDTREKLTEAIKKHLDERAAIGSMDKAINEMKKIINNQPNGFQVPETKSEPTREDRDKSYQQEIQKRQEVYKKSEEFKNNPNSEKAVVSFLSEMRQSLRR